MKTKVLDFIGWGALLAFAGILRARHLGDQVLGGDELHLLKVIRSTSTSGILGLVTDTDFSIPLAVLARWVSGQVALSEDLLRLPVFLVGTVTPLLFVLGCRRLFPGVPVVWAGWLLAAHPLFIFYGRFVRPYGLCGVLLFLTWMALIGQVRSGKKRTAAAAVLLGALASWVHLVSLITVAWLYATALFSSFVRREKASEGGRGTGPGAVALSGLVCALLTGLLYLPAWDGIREQIVGGNLGEGGLTAEVIRRNVAVLCGLPGSAAPWVLGGLAISGLVFVAVRRPGLLPWLLVPVAGQVLTLLILKPRLLHFSFVLARYLYYALPFVLWLVALGIEGVGDAARGAMEEGRRGLRDPVGRRFRVRARAGPPRSRLVDLRLRSVLCPPQRVPDLRVSRGPELRRGLDAIAAGARARRLPRAARGGSSDRRGSRGGELLRQPLRALPVLSPQAGGLARSRR